MKLGKVILCFLLFSIITIESNAAFEINSKNTDRIIDFFGTEILVSNQAQNAPTYQEELNTQNILKHYQKLCGIGFEKEVQTILQYKKNNQLDDWIFYQLIRKTANAIAPKKENYISYTLMKWFLLTQAGYDAKVCYNADTILLYVQSDETIFDIPFYTLEQKQYICLNYHDYKVLDFDNNNRYTTVSPLTTISSKSFSYKLTQLPKFGSDAYTEKQLSFEYKNKQYDFTIKINEHVKSIFANYPVADYQLYFEIPLSPETYASLIPQLKKNIAGLNLNQGIDYIMRFTRNAFPYQTDQENFGKEKRLLAEQTLLSNASDCEDRAALFFYLIKEIYHLPMIVLAYPKHVTVAIQLPKANGKPILYNGQKYYVCEPTPQREDLKIGQISSEILHEHFEIAYSYQP